MQHYTGSFMVSVMLSCVFVQQCFDEVERAYDETSGREKKMTRDDWAHGSLLITTELLRCSNIAAEVCFLMCYCLLLFYVG